MSDKVADSEIREPIVLATIANEAYFHGLCVTVLSAIISTSSDQRLRIYALDTGLSEESRGTLSQLVGSLGPAAEVVFHDVDGSRFEGFSTDYGGGHSTYARLMLGEVVPEKRVIYLDADFLVCRDLGELWSREISPHVMLAAPDLAGVEGSERRLSCDCPFLPAHVADGFTYFNCGFLFVDLEAWRRDNLGVETVRQVAGYEEKLGAWDQTILNYVLRGKIGRLESHWSRSCWVDAVIEPENYHYVSNKKPWNHGYPMPLYRAWYEFHRIFVRPSRRLDLGIKARLSGRLCYVRDFLCARHRRLAGFYLGNLRRRQGTRIADAYEIHLKRFRRALSDRRWRCTKDLERLVGRWLELAGSRCGGIADGNDRPA